MTPRVGAAVRLNEAGTATLSGGFGLFFERTPSTAGAFNDFESMLDTRFVADGTTDADEKLEEGALAKLRAHSDAHLFQQRSPPPDHHALL